MQNKSALKNPKTLLRNHGSPHKNKHGYLPQVKSPKINNNSDLEGELVGMNRIETYESNEQLESDI